jgi:hypothetical protein
MWKVYVRHSTGAMGRIQPDHGIDIDLQNSKVKDCDRQPHRYVLSPVYERGKACLGRPFIKVGELPLSNMLAEFP